MLFFTRRRSNGHRAFARIARRTGEATDLFGAERGDQLHGISGAIEQTFGGQALYPTVQARAAHFLYFVIKDHPFADGNKRIGMLLFLEYLRRNRMLIRADGRPRLADKAMKCLRIVPFNRINLGGAARLGNGV